MGSRVLEFTRDDTTLAAPPVSEPTQDRVVTRYLSRHPFDVTLAIIVAVTAFALQCVRFATFRSAVYDMAVYDQVLWKMANGRGATSSLTAWNTFGDHFSPILLVFVPLYRLAATPLWLFAAQALAFALAVLCARALANAVGLRGRADVINAVVFLVAINPALWNAMLFDFHPTTLAIPVLIFGCTAALTSRHRDMWLACGALLLLRDDLGLAAAAMAVVGWTLDTGRGRRTRAAIVAVGLGWTVIGARIGTALGASRHFEVRYGYLGDSMVDAALNPVHSALGALQHLFTQDNSALVVSSLVAFAVLPLLRPAWLLLAGFVAMPNLLAVDVNLHDYSLHYGAPVTPFLILAAAGGLARFNPQQARRWAGAALPIAVCSLMLLGPPAVRSVTQRVVDRDDARAAVALVRPGDVVTAGDGLGTHVAHRNTLLPYPYPFVSQDMGFPLDPQVRSISRASKEAVDVIIVARPRSRHALAVLRRVLTTDAAQEFERTEVGSVLVFRRRA